MARTAWGCCINATSTNEKLETKPHGERGLRTACPRPAVQGKLVEHGQNNANHGKGVSEIRNWKWGATAPEHQSSCGNFAAR